MSTPNQIVIKNEKEDDFFSSLFLWVHGIQFWVKTFVDDIHDSKSFSWSLLSGSVINTVFLAASLALGFVATKRLLDKGDGLIINNMGVMDNSDWFHGNGVLD